MIARLWTARAPLANAGRYAQHLRDAVLSQIRPLPGYEGATLLERPDGDQVEIIVVTWWRSLEDIRAFAGADTHQAVVADQAHALLAHFDREVRHFEVALDDRPTA